MARGSPSHKFNLRLRTFELEAAFAVAILMLSATRNCSGRGPEGDTSSPRGRGERRRTERSHVAAVRLQGGAAASSAEHLSRSAAALPRRACLCVCVCVGNTAQPPFKGAARPAPSPCVQAHTYTEPAAWFTGHRRHEQAPCAHPLDPSSPLAMAAASKSLVSHRDCSCWHTPRDSATKGPLNNDSEVPSISQLRLWDICTSTLPASR
jgi:hypothetical protein